MSVPLEVISAVSDLCSVIDRLVKSVPGAREWELRLTLTGESVLEITLKRNADGSLTMNVNVTPKKEEERPQAEGTELKLEESHIV